MVVYTCNPSTWKVEVGGQLFKLMLYYIARYHRLDETLLQGTKQKQRLQMGKRQVSLEKNSNCIHLGLLRCRCLDEVGLEETCWGVRCRVVLKTEKWEKAAGTVREREPSAPI